MIALALRVIGGPLGGVVIGAVGAVLLTSVSAAAVQTWRLDAVRSERDKLAARFDGFKADNDALRAQVVEQNRELAELRLGCAKTSAEADRGAGETLETLRARYRAKMITGDHGPRAMEEFVRELYP